MSDFFNTNSWKNVEDVVLKAGIMKYGLNNWSRVASLLNRKTAKQCKARWYEWLDPSQNRERWTDKEDEKLIHLYKIFPTQWRTISAQLKRTPNQCIIRYTRLISKNLDIGNDKLIDNLAQRLSAEEQPALPDMEDQPIEDREMLSEARARLANTKNKKSKRKARERALEEKRDKLNMVKFNELANQGIIRVEKKKKNKLDYDSEIPFQIKPIKLLYNTSTEEKAKKNVLDRINKQYEDEKIKLNEKKDKLFSGETSKKVDQYKKKNNKLLKIQSLPRDFISLSQPCYSDIDLNASIRNEYTCNEYIKILLYRYDQNNDISKWENLINDLRRNYINTNSKLIIISSENSISENQENETTDYMEHENPQDIDINQLLNDNLYKGGLISHSNNSNSYTTDNFNTSKEISDSEKYIDSFVELNPRYEYLRKAFILPVNLPNQASSIFELLKGKKFDENMTADTLNAATDRIYMKTSQLYLMDSETLDPKLLANMIKYDASYPDYNIMKRIANKFVYNRDKICNATISNQLKASEYLKNEFSLIDYDSIDFDTFFRKYSTILPLNIEDLRDETKYLIPSSEGSVNFFNFNEENKKHFLNAYLNNIVLLQEEIEVKASSETNSKTELINYRFDYEEESERIYQFLDFCHENTVSKNC